jgi:hypothetical protein
MNSEEHIGQVLAPPPSNENEHGAFQQDDVTTHIANTSMAASHNTFGDQLMNQSPFMAYYYLSACFIDNNYKNNTHTEGALTVTI